MNKDIIDRFLVMLAMFLLTFVFAALARHYDIFAASFNSQPVSLTNIALAGGILLLCICVTCFFCPPLILFPFIVLIEFVGKMNLRRYFYNTVLFFLCGAFIYFAINLVAIYEYLSGEVVKQQATFGGYLAVIYAWVILFGTIYLFYRISGLHDAIIRTLDFFDNIDDKTRKNKTKNHST